MPLSNAELALELEATVDGWQAFVNSIKAWSVDQVDTVSWEDPLGGPDIITDTLWRIKEDYSALTGSEWAITPEDVLVPTGNLIDQYSALHYSIKAGDSASAASTSETNAAASETAASASAANALSSENAAAASETAAAGSEVVTAQNVTTASRYATELEDVIVLTGAGLSTGDYSALHYSAKSAAAKGLAETARDTALSWSGVSYNWAQYPEDALVPQGNMTTEYSAYHWAQKAAASAGALTPPASDGTYYAYGDGAWSNTPEFVSLKATALNPIITDRGVADACYILFQQFDSTTMQIGHSTTGEGLLDVVADDLRIKAGASNALRLEAGGAERIRVLSTGDVGIGTTSPTAELHISRGAGVRTQLWMDGNIADQFKVNVNVDESVALLNSSTTGPFTLGANGTERVRITAAGFVGIGETAPTRALNVVGSNNCVANIKGTTANGYLSFSSSGTTNDTQVAIGANGDDMRLLAGGSERARITSAGRFGIGTTTPDYAIEANGSLDNSAIAFGASPEIGINVSNSSGVSLGTHADLLFRVSSVGKSGISGIYEGYDAAGLGTALGFHTAETANGNVMAEKMRLTNQGTLGLGTTAPVCVGMHIVAIDSSVMTPTTNSATHPLCVQREQNVVVALRAGATYQSRIEFGGTAANYGRLARIACSTDDANLIFETGGGNSIASSEVARITSAGKLGIGETSPQRALHVDGTGQGGALMLEGASTSNSLVFSSPNLTYYNTIYGNLSDAANYGMVFQVQGSAVMTVNSKGINLTEQASAPGTAAGQGYIWVKNTTPCQLWFTDDTGTSTQIV